MVRGILKGAGVGAVISALADTTTHSVDIRKIQKELLHQGVYLGDEDRLKTLGLTTPFLYFRYHTACVQPGDYGLDLLTLSMVKFLTVLRFLSVVRLLLLINKTGAIPFAKQL